MPTDVVYDAKISDMEEQGLGKTKGQNIFVGVNATVFRPRCTHIGVRLKNLKRAPKGRTIRFVGQLLSIESSKVKSRLVLECKKTLNDLASRNKVILTWVPGHTGVWGNEEADRLAREGSAMYPIGRSPY
ncbi:hypothetical protein NQ317_004034 [Molorchus minor]|uniref:RNase H type-1 domain-containing protein n=1 Tax=Molorchus minor TaxID=1323400 RepID=A0ABQ9JTF1_9CUCU|nr:hypothetical protein NQ317_004034 [Molorchus minor]